uniref:Uncharacterized protein MANES_18G101000 n=1 Tax=Rhizophora mucronata TaxID=61149 RepID=A0A2P2KMW9_RHIMU
MKSCVSYFILTVTGYWSYSSYHGISFCFLFY